MEMTCLYPGKVSLFFFFLFLFICQNATEITSTNMVLVTDIGAIIDVSSRIGKEEKTTVELAVWNFNNNSRNHMLSLHFRHRGGDPLQAACAAEEVMKEKKVKLIAGMETWDEASLVAVGMFVGMLEVAFLLRF